MDFDEGYNNSARRRGILSPEESENLVNKEVKDMNHDELINVDNYYQFDKVNKPYEPLV